MNKKILVCDDDEGILDMVSFVLEDSGYDVIPERNSLNVYSLIEKEQPDLLLLDLWMPVLSGDQVLRVLKSNPQTKGLPVIVISASTEGKKIAEEAGASSFIAKPFDIDQLVNRVQHMLQ
ncbi:MULTISPECIES: response regulator transcription factor [unclassified Mucilaginibacter]|uniref:response regulator n=1 Tax=unclassified Mucilaginibacter TaxID=2617802 RepID=UPI0031F648AC